MLDLPCYTDTHILCCGLGQADANAGKESERVANEHQAVLAKFAKQGKSMATMAQGSETERKIMALQAESRRANELKAEVEAAQRQLDATRRTPTASFRGGGVRPLCMRVSSTHWCFA